MTIEEIKTARDEGIPFEIETAAGRKFIVTDSHNIIISGGRKSAFILSDDDLVHAVPLLTITSLAYLKAQK